MRECGTCTVCCTVTRVPELNKPERVTCSHCTHHCSIYETRPNSCRTFACAWLQGDLADDMRPDQIGVMFEKHENLVVALRWPANGDGKWRTSAIEKELRSAYVDKGIPVVADDWSAMIPPGVKPEDVRAAVFDAAHKVLGG